MGIALAAMTAAGAAHANLEICNDTAATQTVAIGYQGADDWTSEGWWIIAPGECSIPLAGDLQQRYYYYRATSDDGVIEGDYSFCVDTEAFTIVGDTECERRGYETVDFEEIDTGPTALTYTFRIAAAGVSPVTPPMPDPVVPPTPDIVAQEPVEGSARIGGSRLPPGALR
ncbi:DUF1036 domain-containing protein [Rhodobacteraceae bacterium ASV31]|nr:DUF1036 domain-containing protein [Anianabacter salinae]